jgi:hypothetical protein
VLVEHGAGQQAGYSPVAVLEGMDDEKVQDEQPGQEDWVVLACRDREVVALDEVIDGEGSAGGGHWLEADGRRAIG